MQEVKYEGNTYVKIGGQWYWSVGESLEAWYHDEEILDGLLPNIPTDAERERLVVLMEECGEVIQAAANILRFGWDSQYAGITNAQRLRDEMDDVQGMIWAIGQMDDAFVSESPSQVWERKRRWMKHQG